MLIILIVGLPLCSSVCLFRISSFLIPIIISSSLPPTYSNLYLSVEHPPPPHRRHVPSASLRDITPAAAAESNASMSWSNSSTHEGTQEGVWSSFPGRPSGFITLFFR